MAKETGMNPTGANPYVGPRTFTAQESHLFFGRESEARDLVSLVISEHIVLFYAQSGAGKSSLINTRLVPLLQKKGFEVLPVGRVSGAMLPDEPLDNVFMYNLELSLDQSMQAPERFCHLPLVTFLANLNAVGETFLYSVEADGVPEIPADAQAAAPPEAPLEIWPRALIIDQFEELFTTHSEAWERRADFFRQLAVALAADPYLWVVLTMREDHVAALDPYAALLPGRLRARFYMQRMGRAAALEAVRQPVAELRPFAPGVAELLVDNLRLITADETPGAARALVPGEFIEPVQLQVVCYQLWQTLQTLQTEQPEGEATREITENDLVRLAKGADLAQFVNQALADFYEQSLAKVLHAPGSAGSSPDSTGVTETKLRDWFSNRLITEAETRAFVYQGEEQTAGLPNAAVALLVDQHIIRSEVRAGGVWYELVHDRFVNPILQSNRLWQRKLLRPITQAAEAWVASGRNKNRLYDGNQLKGTLASTNPAELNELERQFLDASRKSDLDRRAGYRRRLVILIVMVFITMIGIMRLYWEQQTIAQQEAARANQQAELAATESNKAATAAQEAILASTMSAQQAQLARTEAANAKIQEATAVKAIGDVQDQISQQQTVIPMYRNTIVAVQKYLPTTTTSFETPTQTATPGPTATPGIFTPISPNITLTFIFPRITLTPTILTRIPGETITTHVIGRSVKGNELRVAQVGKGERAVLVIGGLHAGYAPSTVRLAQLILDYYTKNPERIPAGTSLHVLVNANPDSPENPGDVSGRLNANQVDLVTNSDCNWVPTVELFNFKLSAGKAPFSEPEIRALRDYTQKILPVAVISYEAKSDGWVYPGGCLGKYIYSMPLARLYANSSRYGLTGGTGSDHGDFMDWLDSQGSPAIAVLLADYTRVDSQEQHLKAIQAVLEWNGK